MKTLVLILFLFVSCSHMKSGQYVQLRENDSLKSLSKEFKVPIWSIEEANKDREFRVGEWYFIPLQHGIAQAWNDDFYSRRPASHDSYSNDENFLWPVPSSYKMTSGYGRRWGGFHAGIDISAPEGNHIVAANDGVVVFSGRGSGLRGYGNIIVIAHYDGYFTVYAHNQKNYVSRNDTVYRGQVIGRLGNTGRSTGPHLHFEIRRSGRPYNPVNFLVKK